jgi:hypothetical protein
LTGSGRSDLEFCRDGTRNGLTSPNKELAAMGEGIEATALPAGIARAERVERKSLGEGVLGINAGIYPLRKRLNHQYLKQLLLPLQYTN